MKPAMKVEELEQSIDFERVNKRLLELTASGGFKRRKTVADLLDKVKEALLKARESGVSFPALSAFLQESGIPVSQATLRQYVRAQTAGKKPRRKSAAKVTGRPTVPAQPFGERKVPVAPQSAQSMIEANRAQNATEGHHSFRRRERGPRIADPKNF